MSDFKRLKCFDSSVTVRDEVQFDYKWSIQDFFNLPHVHKEALWSDRFPSADGQVAYWQLSLYPRGNNDNEDYLALFLHLKSSIGSTVRFEYSLEAKDEEGNTLNAAMTSQKSFSAAGQSNTPSNYNPYTGMYDKQTVTFKQLINHSDKCTGYSSYMERYKLKEALNRSKAGTLIIHCSVTVFLDVVNKRGPCSKTDYKVFTDTYSSKDLECLLLDESYSDFAINIDNRKFKVHKNILHARSSVFAAMFNSKMKESKSSEVTLDDVDPDVFEKVLRFIYTGSLATMDSDALDLLPVADKYNISCLKEQCADLLAARICSMDAVKTLILADAHHVEDLKKVAVEFISKNTEVVSKTDEWELLVAKYPKLTTELLLARKSS